MPKNISQPRARVRATVPACVRERGKRREGGWPLSLNMEIPQLSQKRQRSCVPHPDSDDDKIDANVFEHRLHLRAGGVSGAMVAVIPVVLVQTRHPHHSCFLLLTSS